MSDPLSGLSKKIRPQDDLFRHVNDSWIRKHPIPATQSSWTTFSELHDRVQHQLKEVLEKLATGRPTDPAMKKLQAYWRVGMDEKKAEALGAEPMLEELARIDAVDSRKELSALIARLDLLGASVFWGWYVDADLKRSSVTTFELFQSGLGLPDRDYYLKQDAGSKKIRAAYPLAIAKLLRLAGWSAQEARHAAQAVVRIETRLARASMTGAERRDLQKSYHKMTLAELRKTAPNVDWAAYLDALGVKKEHARTMVVFQPLFIKECSRILRTEPLEDIKAYLSWHLVASSAPYLSDDFVQARFAFYGKTLTGQKEMRPRWKRVVAEIDALMGEQLGQLYVKKHFPESARKRMQAIIDDLTATYRARMTALPWMSVKTIARALEKLDAVKRKIGYPDRWRSYAAFKPDETSYLAMHWAAYRAWGAWLISRLGKPVNRNEWPATPQTVNAFYQPTYNEITFLAGILQPPYFHKDGDDALNYGAIGVVVAHELTHAFDDMGSTFDKDGNMRNWWTKTDHAKFKAEADKLAKQFSTYVVIDGLRCDGKLTLGENIADLGGVAIAYEAFARRMGKRMTKKTAQRFFSSYARVWAGSTRPAEIRRRLITDPHAPNSLRVNAVVANLQEFHDAFDVKPGDKLYRKPADRVSIW